MAAIHYQLRVGRARGFVCLFNQGNAGYCGPAALPSLQVRIFLGLVANGEADVCLP